MEAEEFEYSLIEWFHSSVGTGPSCSHRFGKGFLGDLMFDHQTSDKPLVLFVDRLAVKIHSNKCILPGRKATGVRKRFVHKYPGCNKKNTERKTQRRKKNTTGTPGMLFIPFSPPHANVVTFNTPDPHSFPPQNRSY